MGETSPSAAVWAKPTWITLGLTSTMRLIEVCNTVFRLDLQMAFDPCFDTRQVIEDGSWYKIGLAWADGSEEPNKNIPAQHPNN